MARKRCFIFIYLFIVFLVGNILSVKCSESIETDELIFAHVVSRLGIDKLIRNFITNVHVSTIWLRRFFDMEIERRLTHFQMINITVKNISRMALDI